MARKMDTLERVRLRVQAGGWVPVCRANAEALNDDAELEVQCMPFSKRRWEPLYQSGGYKASMKFRVRTKPVGE